MFAPKTAAAAVFGAIWPQTRLFHPRLEALHASRAFGISIGRKTN
jgi:hypothetical protein